MKLAVKQENLSKALGAVGRIATAKAGLPILANILVRTDNNKLIVAATNLEVAMIEVIGAQVENQGAIAVPARLLTDFVNNLPHINIEIDADETKFNISAGGYKSTINSISAEDYPALPEPKDQTSFEIKADLFKKAITTVAFAASNDTTRPILTGVYMRTIDGQLVMAATDGYRLAERTVCPLDVDLSAIVPASTLLDVARVMTESDVVTVKYDDEQISFISGDLTVTSRLIDGTYVDYRQLINTDTTYQITVNRSEFIRITKVAQLFARELAGSIVIETHAKNKELSVRSAVTQIGTNSSTVEADIKGDVDSTINVNSKYLIDALNNLDGDEVTLHYNGKLAPVLMTGSDSNYRNMVMPVNS